MVERDAGRPVALADVTPAISPSGPTSPIRP